MYIYISVTGVLYCNSKEASTETQNPTTRVSHLSIEFQRNKVIFLQTQATQQEGAQSASTMSNVAKEILQYLGNTTYSFQII